MSLLTEYVRAAREAASRMSQAPVRRGGRRGCISALLDLRGDLEAALRRHRGGGPGSITSCSKARTRRGAQGRRARRGFGRSSSRAGSRGTTA